MASDVMCKVERTAPSLNPSLPDETRSVVQLNPCTGQTMSTTSATNLNGPTNLPTTPLGDGRTVRRPVRLVPEEVQEVTTIPSTRPPDPQEIGSQSPPPLLPEDDDLDQPNGTPTALPNGPSMLLHNPLAPKHLPTAAALDLEREVTRGETGIGEFIRRYWLSLVVAPWWMHCS